MRRDCTSGSVADKRTAMAGKLRLVIIFALRPMRSTIASQPYVYPNGSLDGPPSTGDGWASFEFMMFGDGQSDPHATFANDDKSDDVASYGNYLHDDLQPPVEPTHHEDEPQDVAPATLEPPDEVGLSPIVL